MQLCLIKDFTQIGVSDSTGALYCKDGLDMETLLEQKTEKGLCIKEIGGTMLSSERLVLAYASAKEMLSSECTQYTVLFDVSPVHLDVGIECIRMALHQGIHVVAANKSVGAVIALSYSYV